MQKGRILLTIFFSIFSLLLITFATFLIFKASASQKNEGKQKITAQIATAEIKLSQISTPHRETKTLTRSSASLILTSTPTLTPNPAPTVSQQVISEDLNPNDFILEKVNEYRVSIGLSRVSANSESCSFAQTRAQEISSLEIFNHDGFTMRVNSNTLPYPSFSEVTENIAYNTDYKDVVSKWIDSAGHEQNLRKDTPYVCIGNYGDYYVYEGWRP